MGSAGESDNHPSHKVEIANGIDKGNGYQGYMNISYFFQQDYIPQETKIECARILKSLGYSDFTSKLGY
jgi:hypothetical protein